MSLQVTPLLSELREGNMVNNLEDLTRSASEAAADIHRLQDEVTLLPPSPLSTSPSYNEAEATPQDAYVNIHWASLFHGHMLKQWSMMYEECAICCLTCPVSWMITIYCALAREGRVLSFSGPGMSL